MKNVKDYNKSLNEGEIDFSDKSISGRKALPIKQVAELIKKASKEDVDKLLKTLTKKQVKDMEGMKKGGGSDAGSLAAILTDEKGQPRVHWLKNRLSEYVNEENDFADNPSMNESKVLTGEEVAKALRKLDQKYDGVMSKDFIIKVKRLKRVTKETLEKMGAKGKILDDIFDLLKEGKDEFAGWVAFYNRNRIEIDKSEAKDISQAKQIAIKKLKVPKSKVGLLAIAPGYNESMHEAKEDKLYKSIDALEKEARKILAPIEIGSFIAQLDDLRQFLQGNVVLEKIEMNNLDWGKTTAERNKNLDHFDSLKTDKEKEDFKKKLKSINEGKNDYSARFGKTDITIKNGHKLTDEDSLYDMYEKIGKVIKDSGLDLGSVIIKESQSVNEGKITDYVTALGTVVAQVGVNPKLDKYHEMKGKRGFIKLQELKDLPKEELIALANSL